jgi:hypothetical protein
VSQNVGVYHTSSDNVSFIPIGTNYLSFKPGTPTDGEQGVLDRLFDQTDKFRGKEAFERRAKLTMLPRLDTANFATSNDSRPTDGMHIG